MVGSTVKRTLFSWLLHLLGPPPPPPRRYFSKSWDWDAQYRVVFRRGGGAESHALRARETVAADSDSPRVTGGNGRSES